MSLPDLGPLVRFDERLREVAVDPRAVEAALSQASRALDAAEERDERLRLLTYAGNAARILGRADQAIRHLSEALRLADGDRAIAARIRLGEAYRCADRLDDAERELGAALAEARRAESHVDFALQHFGKALLDNGEAARAVPLLEEALELRLKRGDGDLAESSELALTRARFA